MCVCVWVKCPLTVVEAEASLEPQLLKAMAARGDSWAWMAATAFCTCGTTNTSIVSDACTIEWVINCARKKVVSFSEFLEHTLCHMKHFMLCIRTKSTQKVNFCRNRVLTERNEIIMTEL